MDPRLLELDLKTSIHSLADIFLPRVCVACGRNLLPQERHLCVTCLADLPRTRYELLSRNPMSDRFNSRFGDGPYAYASALFHYVGRYCEITRSLKYRRNFAAGRYFAQMLGEALAAGPCFADVDFVAPVPLFWTRSLSRGYNQAGIIAREVALSLGVPCVDNLLRRRRRTRSQAGVRSSGVESVDEKSANVRGAFAVNAKALPVLGEAHHILLVDDVFTTGATLYACYEAVRLAAGVRLRISVASLAFAG